MMPTNDAETLQHVVTQYSKYIPDYVDKHNHNMTARNIFAQRKIGADVMIDVATHYAETGDGAQIVAKGGIVETTGVKATKVNFDMFQYVNAFNINEKDLKLDPSLKKKEIDMLLRSIHKKEDNIAINGDTSYGVTGLVTAARANTNGKLTAAATSGSNVGNQGKWSGETGTDIYEDIRGAIDKMDEEFEPAFIVGNRTSLGYLNRLDSERNTYADSIASLFGKKNEKDRSFLWTSKQFADDYVYIIPKDDMAAEFVVSENPRLVAYPKSAGENYRIEMVGWAGVEFHNNDGFVEIQIT